MKNRRKEVMVAIVRLADGVATHSEYVEMNDIIDRYRRDFPVDAVSSIIDIYEKAVENYDMKTLEMIDSYARLWL